MPTPSRTALMALCTVGLCACDDPARPGTIAVEWRTGQLTCAEAGVASVRAELFGYGAIDPVDAVERVCPEGGTALDDVEPGEYTLLLSGYDADGCWTHEAREDLQLTDGEDVEIDLPLLRRVRPLWVRWPFENELDCAGNGVDQVQITIDVEDRFTWTDAFLCPGLAIEIPIDVPVGDIEVEVVGLDTRQRPIARGEVVAPGTIFTSTPCEDRIEVRAPMVLCISPGCQSD